MWRDASQSEERKSRKQIGGKLQIQKLAQAIIFHTIMCRHVANNALFQVLRKKLDTALKEADFYRRETDGLRGRCSEVMLDKSRLEKEVSV